MYPEIERISVSVIVPCYRHVDKLRRAISSINSQTVTPLEVIIINDGGPIFDEHLIAKLIIEFPRLNFKIKSLSSNQGAGQARNVGWEMASGEFIAFLDADDSWHPMKLEIQFFLMLKNPDILLSGHNHSLDTSGSVACINHEPVLRPLTKFMIFFKNPFITPSVMLKRSIKARFNPKQRHCEDYRLWLEIAALNIKVGYIDLPLAYLYKPSISTVGLSSNTFKMSIGEIKAYLSLMRISYLYIPIAALLVPFSLVKSIRRMIIRLIAELKKEEWNE